MIDALSATRTFLQDNSQLTAITNHDTESGIYRTDLPKGVIKNDRPPKCVVLQQLPGPSAGTYPHIEPRFYVKCYGPTSAGASEVYGRVWDAFYPGGIARRPTMINDRWLMRSADLSQPLVTTEPEGWSVAIATLDATFDPLVGAT